MTDQEKEDFNYIALSLARGEDIEKREETTINTESNEVGILDELANQYNPDSLFRLVKDNSSFAPIVEAITTNTVGFGYSIISREQTNDKEEDTNTKEYIDIENFFRYVNHDQDLRDLCLQLLSDYCYLAYSVCEITRNQIGEIDGLYRVQPNKIRFCRKNDNPTTYLTKRIYKNYNGTYSVKQRMDSKRFRLYVHYLDNGNKIYYKEFQDPNTYTKNEGKLLTSKRDINKAIKENNIANEVWVMMDTQTNSVYPDPKYSGSIIDCLGDIHAARTNASTLNNNLVPNIAIIGDLDSNSIQRIKEFQRERQDKTYNRSKILVLSASKSEDNALDKGQNRISIEKLKDEQITDSMFNDYRDINRRRVLQSFRLPELLIAGNSVAADRATLESALKFADEQVFNPKRVKIQKFINDYLLPELNISNLVIKFNTPDITDPRTLIDLVRFFESSGAVTPERADIILEFILGRKLPEIKGINLKEPYSKAMAEAVKNTKDPTNLNQQAVGGRIKNPAKDADKYNDKPKG